MSEVRVAWTPTADAPPEAHALGLAWMQPEEREKHDRFAFEHSRAEYRVARWLSRMQLSREAPVPPEVWRFAPNAHGRPEVVAPAAQRSLRFSITHTPGLVAVAIARGGEVGLDAEDAGRAGDFLGVAHRYFAPSELAELRALPDPAARLERFFALWTLKEAYLKARGVGLGLPLDCFAFGFGANGLSFACDARAGDDAGRWGFWQHRPTERHRLAVATTIRGADDGPRIVVERAEAGGYILP